MGLVVPYGHKLEVESFQELDDRLKILSADLVRYKARNFFNEVSHYMVEKGFAFGKSMIAIEDQQLMIKVDFNEPSVYEFDILIYPFENNFYSRPMSNCNDMVNFFRDQDWISYYGFWDNACPEEAVSEEVWQERGRVWNSIFSSNGSMCSKGYQRKLLDYRDFRLKTVYTDELDSVMEEVFKEHNLEVPDLSKHRKG